MPLAMILGMAVLIALYVSVTLVYHWVLPLSQVAAASTDRKTARDIDRIANTLLLNTDEHQNAISAFVAKRTRRS